MAYSDRYTGRELVVVFTPAGGGGPYTLTGDFTAFSMDRAQDTVDVSAGNQESRQFLTTLNSLDWTLSIYNGDESILQHVTEGAAGLLEVYPRGNSAGKPKRSFNIIVTSYNESFPFDNVAEVEIGGIRNGAMVADVGTVV